MQVTSSQQGHTAISECQRLRDWARRQVPVSGETPLEESQQLPPDTELSAGPAFNRRSGRNTTESRGRLHALRNVVDNCKLRLEALTDPLDKNVGAKLTPTRQLERPTQRLFRHRLRSTCNLKHAMTLLRTENFPGASWHTR